jgi:hypothetical protein
MQVAQMTRIVRDTISEEVASFLWKEPPVDQDGGPLPEWLMSIRQSCARRVEAQMCGWHERQESALMLAMAFDLFAIRCGKRAFTLSGREVIPET